MVHTLFTCEIPKLAVIAGTKVQFAKCSNFRDNADALIVKMAENMGIRMPYLENKLPPSWPGCLVISFPVMHGRCSPFAKFVRRAP